MDIDERRKLAFDLAANVIKQVITLSTAIVTITATIARFIFVGASEYASKYLVASWFVFIVSIIFGVMGLMSLAGNMSPIILRKNSKAPSINNVGIRFSVGVQLILFLIGLILVAIYGIKANA